MDCTLVVNSCDAYSDTWFPFFHCLEEYWKDCPYPIVLNTESKHFEYDGFDIKQYKLYPNHKIKWSRMLKETLKRIDTKYVLLTQDDYWLEDVVDQDKVEQCLKWMEQDDNIAVFSFMPAHTPNIKNDKYSGFELRPRNGTYRFNCQIAVWRRERLIKFLGSFYSPWEWEIYGSFAGRVYKDEFYVVSNGDPLIFKYYRGGALRRGKWIRSVVIPIVTKFNFDIDFSFRGFDEETENTNDIKQYSILLRFACRVRAFFKVLLAFI